MQHLDSVVADVIVIGAGGMRPHGRFGGGQEGDAGPAP